MSFLSSVDKSLNQSFQRPVFVLYRHASEAHSQKILCWLKCPLASVRWIFKFGCSNEVGSVICMQYFKVMIQPADVVQCTAHRADWYCLVSGTNCCFINEWNHGMHLCTWHTQCMTCMTVCRCSLALYSMKKSIFLFFFFL